MYNPKHSTEELIEQCKLITSENRDFIFLYRVVVIMLFLQGIPIETIKQHCGVSEYKLDLWLRMVDENGWGSIVPNDTSRLNELHESQLDQVVEAINSDPSKFGYDIWNAYTVSQYIEATFNIKYTSRQSRKLLDKYLKNKSSKK